MYIVDQVNRMTGVRPTGRKIPFARMDREPSFCDNLAFERSTRLGRNLRKFSAQIRSNKKFHQGEMFYLHGRKVTRKGPSRYRRNVENRVEKVGPAKCPQ